jgi:hypothetical protein
MCINPPETFPAGMRAAVVVSAVVPDMARCRASCAASVELLLICTAVRAFLSAKTQ